MDWSKLLSDVLQAVLVLVLPALIGAGVSWLKLKWTVYRDGKGGEWAWALEQAAEIAVRAAEQSKLAGLIKDKKTYAITIAEKYLGERGLAIDLDVLDAAIEAEVQRRFGKTPAQPQ